MWGRCGVGVEWRHGVLELLRSWVMRGKLRCGRNWRYLKRTEQLYGLLELVRCERWYRESCRGWRECGRMWKRRDSGMVSSIWLNRERGTLLLGIVAGKHVNVVGKRDRRLMKWLWRREGASHWSGGMKCWSNIQQGERRKWWQVTWIGVRRKSKMWYCGARGIGKVLLKRKGSNFRSVYSSFR